MSKITLPSPGKVASVQTDTCRSAAVYDYTNMT